MTIENNISHVSKGTVQIDTDAWMHENGRTLFFLTRFYPFMAVDQEKPTSPRCRFTDHADDITKVTIKNTSADVKGNENNNYNKISTDNTHYNVVY